jgi:hypothetical protein
LVSPREVKEPPGFVAVVVECLMRVAACSLLVAFTCAIFCARAFCVCVQLAC